MVGAKRPSTKSKVWERCLLAEVDRTFSIKSLCFKQMGFEAKEILGMRIEVGQIGELCSFDSDILAFLLVLVFAKLGGM